MSDRMLRSVLFRTLRDQKRAFIGFGLGMVAFALFLAAFYPTIRDQQEEFEQLMEVYPPAMREMFGISDMASAPGFVHAELFSLMAPLLFIIYAMGRAADMTAGEEERGAMDVLLTHPLSRRRVLLEKMGGLALGLLGLAAVTYAALMVASVAMGMGIGALELGAEMLLLLLLTYALAGITLVLATWRGRKGFAVGIGAAIAAAAYVLYSFGALVEGLTTLRKVSPFYYYSSSAPLIADFEPLHAVVLALVAAVAVVAAVWLFERRDLAT